MIPDTIFKQFPLLATSRLHLRAYETKDAPAIFQLRSNEDVMRFMDRQSYQTLAEAEKEIDEVIESFKKGDGVYWVLEEKDTKEVIGYCCYWRLMKKHARAEIGYALLPTYWGKGFMREAASAVINFAFQKMKLHSIEANVNPDNQSSIHLLTQLGFQKEGHFRENYFYNNQFMDTATYSLLERDFSKNQ